MVQANTGHTTRSRRIAFVLLAAVILGVTFRLAYQPTVDERVRLLATWVGGVLAFLSGTRHSSLRSRAGSDRMSTAGRVAAIALGLVLVSGPGLLIFAFVRDRTDPIAMHALGVGTLELVIFGAVASCGVGLLYVAASGRDPLARLRPRTPRRPAV
jgi:hypothetical protein